MKPHQAQECIAPLPVKYRLAKSIALALLLSTSQTQAQSEQADESNDWEQIEITAQKRVQNVMQVPITLGIVSADTLEQATAISLGDVDKFIPGFSFQDSSVTQSGIRIRGISSPAISVGGDPSSATFYDDVYMPRAAQNVLFSDIQRIEVLKGPQGTLFGRNAAMGVVNIIPNKPEDETEGFVKGSFGTDNLVRLEGMANLPLTDTLFVRANVLSNKQDGYINNTARPAWNNDSKIWDLGARDHLAGRLSLLWNASADTTLQLTVELDDLEQAPPMAIGLSEFALNGGSDPFAPEAENDVRLGVESRDMFAVVAKVEHEFDSHWSMKYVASIRDWETVNREDEDGTADITRYFDTSNNEDSDIFYSEFQLSYVNDKVNAIAGFSYSKEDVSQQTELNITADTIARLTTGALNDTIRGGFAQQIAAMIGGNTDEAAAAAFGPGATFEGVVDATFMSQGFPLDHIWQPDQWAGALTALGFADAITTALGMPGVPLTGDIVSATGDITYDIVANQLGIAEIFGPGFSGQFWQENVFNTGDFTNWGVFADIDYAITPKWHVIGGLRYSKDKKDFTWRIPQTTFVVQRPGVTNQLFPQVDLSAFDSWDKVTGRLVTNYQLDNRQMVFASYSTGYKSGGFDSLVPIDQSAGQQAFEPEDSVNLEIGYKAVLWDQVVANISYYDTELDNFQISVESRPPGAPQAVPSIINENRQISGVEIDLRWSVNDSLNLAVVSEIRETDIDTPEFYDSTGTLVAATSRSFDAETNYTFSLDWTPDIDSVNMTFHLDYVFIENTNDQRPDIQPFELLVPGYLSDRKDLNARVSFSGQDDTWEAALWTRNLLDERYVESISNRTTATLGTPFGRVNRGREMGIELKYRF